MGRKPGRRGQEDDVRRRRRSPSGRRRSRRTRGLRAHRSCAAYFGSFAQIRPGSSWRCSAKASATAISLTFSQRVEAVDQRRRCRGRRSRSRRPSVPRRRRRGPSARCSVRRPGQALPRRPCCSSENLGEMVMRLMSLRGKGIWGLGSELGLMPGQRPSLVIPENCHTVSYSPSYCLPAWAFL